MLLSLALASACPGIAALADALADTRAAEARAVAFVDVSVVSMEDEALLEHRTVLVRGDRIVSVAPTDEAEPPADAEVVDGTGKFLMPGLCDMHVHLSDPRDGLLYVANGVTTIRNLSGQPLHLDLAEVYRRGEMVGPTLVTSGPQVRLPEDATESQAAAVVAEHQAQGYSCVKLYGRTSLENYRAMAAASRELGMPIVGHVPRNLTLEEVAEVGGHREISHAEEMLYSFFGRKQEPAPDVMDECVALVRSSGAYVTPTISVYAEILPQVAALESVLGRLEMRFLPPLGHLVFGPFNKYTSFDAEDVTAVEQGTGTILELTGALHEAGVPLLLGTDAMNPSVLPGFSIHDELRALVGAGLTPFDALAAGTTVPARFWGIEDEVGRVAAGQRADLVLLDADPLEDVANARAIAGVVLRGRWLSARELEQALTRQVAGYATEAAAMRSVDRTDPAPLLALLAASEDQPPAAFFLSLVCLYLQIGEPGAASLVLDHALEHYPASVLLHNRKAEVLERLGDRQGARRHYERTLELEPANAVARRALRT